MTSGMPLVFASPKRTGLDPGLYRVTHQQFPPKYLRILPTRNNELNVVTALPRRPPPPTANIALQPPVVSRPNVAVLQPGPAKHSYQVILDLLSSPVISTFRRETRAWFEFSETSSTLHIRERVFKGWRGKKLVP